MTQRPKDKATPQQMADAYLRWCQHELCCKPSSKVGRTRRGRLKGDTNRQGQLRVQHDFPYPKRGKHRTAEVKGKIVTVKANA
jgi:hypothetical protein